MKNKLYIKKKIKEIIKNPKILLYKINYSTLKYVIKELFIEYFEFSFIHSLTGIKKKEFDKYVKDFKDHRKFFNQIQRNYCLIRNTYPPYQEWHKVIYILVRAFKPKIMFETGVFDGFSSMFILKAMADNRKGYLVSFDLSAKKPVKYSTNMMRFTHLPKGLKSGWIIPDNLKFRWKLYSGNTRETLPNILKKYRSIDIFLHDSLHTYKHMYWEYNTSWPYIKKNGLLLSDDIHFNSAFKDFNSKISKKYYTIHNFGGTIK